MPIKVVSRHAYCRGYFPKDFTEIRKFTSHVKRHAPEWEEIEGFQKGHGWQKLTPSTARPPLLLHHPVNIRHYDQRANLRSE